MTVQLREDSAAHKDRLKRQGLLQDGDVSAHDIGQASGCGRNVDAGSSGPPFNMQKHHNAFLSISGEKSKLLFILLFSVCFVMWLLLLLGLLDAKYIMSDAVSISLPLFSRSQFRPHASFLSVVYLYQRLQLWCLFSVRHLPHPPQRCAMHTGPSRVL